MLQALAAAFPVQTFATMLAGGAQFLGAREQNQANKDIAQNQQDFQEYMSNTAYRRAAQDLREAGFNPLLATGAQASTPSGASAQMVNTMEGIQASARDAVSQSLQGQKQQAEISNLAETNQLIRSQKKQADAQTLKTTVDAAVAKKGIPESDLKNQIYDIIKPGITKFRQYFQNNSKPQSFKIDSKFWNRPNQQIQDSLNKKRMP